MKANENIPADADDRVASTLLASVEGTAAPDQARTPAEIVAVCEALVPQLIEQSRKAKGAEKRQLLSRIKSARIILAFYGRE